MGAQKFLLLKADIERELAQIESVVAEGGLTLAALPGPPEPLQLRGIGSILHDFYCGIERILERIAAEIDGELPGGADWHAPLLVRMTTEVESLRPAALSQQLAEDLRPYLRFRHLFRNVYGAQLRWELCRGLAEGMPSTWSAFRTEVDAFLSFLSSLYQGCR